MKPGTYGAFKAAMEAAGVQDDDNVRYMDFGFDMGETLNVERITLDGEWSIVVSSSYKDD